MCGGVWRLRLRLRWLGLTTRHAALAHAVPRHARHGRGARGERPGAPVRVGPVPRHEQPPQPLCRGKTFD